MNIFVTDLDPVQAAINLDDKRVKHMPKENFEMLDCYIHHTLKFHVIEFPYWGDEERRKQVEFLYNHPCNRWVRRDRSNMTWLFRHTIALLDEHEFRFNVASPLIGDFFKIRQYLQSSDYPPLTFQNSSLYKDDPIVTAYRRTMVNKWLVTDKIKPVRWTKRETPSWISDYTTEQTKLDI